MRIATWNLEKPAKSGPRREAILQQIAKIKADIWVLTESDIAFCPGEDYRLVAYSSAHAEDLKGARERNSDSVWTTIWSKLPAQRIVTIADHDRTAAALILPEDDAPLLMYGTVLPWPGDPRSKHYRGAAAFVHALNVQAAEWTSLINIVRQQHPMARLCVAGDFNQAWTKDKYVSEQDRVKLMEALCTPYHPLVCVTGEKDPVKAAINRPTIDHICISEQSAGSEALLADCYVSCWAPTSQSVEKLSDHFGLMLEIPNAHHPSTKIGESNL